MLKFGFEWEVFVFDSQSGWPILAAEHGYSHDGNNLLGEIRTVGGQALRDAIFDLKKNADIFYHRLKPIHFVPEEAVNSIKTTAELKQYMRRLGSHKDPVIVQNLYGRKPRNSSAFLASFQINISNVLRESYKFKKQVIPAVYGLLDIPTIVRNFDKAFERHIKESNRQPGMYALKDLDTRLEYRSLPSSVFHEYRDKPFELESIIQSCVESR